MRQREGERAREAKKEGLRPAVYSMQLGEVEGRGKPEP
jgi:hypothetical protein